MWRLPCVGDSSCLIRTSLRIRPSNGSAPRSGESVLRSIPCPSAPSCATYLSAATLWRFESPQMRASSSILRKATAFTRLRSTSTVTACKPLAPAAVPGRRPSPMGGQYLVHLLPCLLAQLHSGCADRGSDQRNDYRALRQYGESRSLGVSAGKLLRDRQRRPLDGQDHERNTKALEPRCLLEKNSPRQLRVDYAKCNHR